mgnify:CR=1 FL=1
MEEFVRNFGLTLLAVMGLSGLLALTLLIIIIVQVRRIHVPEGAGFAETLLYTPFLVVAFLDLLDLALDFLSAPIAWVVLDRLGLKGLRGFATVESFVPFTQMVPTMTLAWLAVRLLGKERFEGRSTYDSRL